MPTLPLTQIDDRLAAADLDNRTFALTFAQPVAIRDLLLLLVRGTSLSMIPDPGLSGAFIGELKNVTVRQALDLMFEEGLENVFHRHRLLAEAVRRAISVWAEGQVISFNIIEPGERCDTVTPVLTNGHDPDALRAYCNEKCGVVLGHGIAELSGKAFRIAHMGHVNAPMVLGTLSVIEMALAALGIPHGRGGAQAAIDWLGEQVKA